MHSFRHSRGRMRFDLFCVLTLAAAMAAAWLQTGATALLAAAAVVLVQGVIPFGDGRRQLEPAAEMPLAPPAPAEPADLAPEPAAAKPAPKKRSRKKAAPDEPAAPVLVEVFPQAVEPIAFEPEHSAPIAPLFEPQPLVRQQRTIFGRKAG